MSFFHQAIRNDSPLTKTLENPLFPPFIHRRSGFRVHKKEENQSKKKRGSSIDHLIPLARKNGSKNWLLMGVLTSCESWAIDCSRSPNAVSVSSPRAPGKMSLIATVGCLCMASQHAPTQGKFIGWFIVHEENEQVAPK